MPYVAVTTGVLVVLGEEFGGVGEFESVFLCFLCLRCVTLAFLLYVAWSYNQYVIKILLVTCSI